MSNNHSHETTNKKNIFLAFFLNAGFAAIEFIGGYLTNSVAIYSGCPLMKSIFCNF